MAARSVPEIIRSSAAGTTARGENIQGGFYDRLRAKARQPLSERQGGISLVCSGLRYLDGLPYMEDILCSPLNLYLHRLSGMGNDYFTVAAKLLTDIPDRAAECLPGRVFAEAL